MRVLLITGTNSGLGFAYCQHLLQSPDMHVVATCRNEAVATSTLAQFKQQQPWGQGTTCQMGVLDLGDFDSIHRFVQWFKELDLPLHVLALHWRKCMWSIFVDKADRLKVNVYGTFLLTYLLLPIMMRQPDARVVTIVSGLLLYSKVNEPLSTVEECKAHMLKDVYPTSKRLQQMSVIAFSHKFPQVSFRGISPGFIPQTGLGRSYSLFTRALIQLMRLTPVTSSMQDGIACYDQGVHDDDPSHNGWWMYRKQWREMDDVTPEQVPIHLVYGVFNAFVCRWSVYGKHAAK